MSKTVLLAGVIFLGVGLVVVGGCLVHPYYRVWQQGLVGLAELRRAEHNRQIKIEEAKAYKDAADHWAIAKKTEATYLAEAEAIRARGVAEANQIIGEGLKDNEAYLRYLWIQGLHDGSSEVIYVPTEANMPILEAGKR